MTKSFKRDRFQVFVLSSLQSARRPSLANESRTTTTAKFFDARDADDVMSDDDSGALLILLFLPSLRKHPKEDYHLLRQKNEVPVFSQKPRLLAPRSPDDRHGSRDAFSSSSSDLHCDWS